MSPGSNFESRPKTGNLQPGEDVLNDGTKYGGTRKARSDAGKHAPKAGTQSVGQLFLPRSDAVDEAPSAALARGKAAVHQHAGAVDEQTRQLIEQLMERVEALEGKSDARSTTGSEMARTEPLERAVAKLSSYDDLMHQAEGREKADLQQWRINAAAEVLRSAVIVVDGHVPDKIAEPLREVQAACERNSSLPSWLDPESFVGMAVIVGMAVLVATGAAPLGAAFVGESILKETIKTAITTLVAGVLMEASSHQLKAMREGRIASADEQPAQPK